MHHAHSIPSKTLAYSVLRYTLLFIATFHLVAGSLLTFSPAAQQFFAGLYGAIVAWNDQSTYLIRVLGSFAFSLGVMAFAAYRAPLANKAIAWGFIVLFVMRNIERHLYWSELANGFSLPTFSNYLTTAFFVVLIVLLVVPLWHLRNYEKQE